MDRSLMLDFPAQPAAAHPPSLPGAPTLEDSYRSLVDALPARLREVAERLPWRLGLTKSADGGWGDFVGLHPNRELPVYTAQAADGGLAIAEAALARYLRAHHVGGFSWLLRDRLEDGQADADPRLLELAEMFDRHWRVALGDATGDVALAEALCERATARWQRGTRAEQGLLAASTSGPWEGPEPPASGSGRQSRPSPTRSMRPPIYAAVVKEKLSWIGVPSHALLLVHGGSRRVKPFLHAHDLFLLGLQAIDDVIDMNQDRALRGADVPTALGCSAGALVRTAPKLVRRAAAAAAGGGFTWFAGWLEAYAGAISAWRLDGDPLGDELDAIGIAGEMEEEVLSDMNKLVRISGNPRAAAPA